MLSVKMNNDKGFTLVEIIVAVTVLAILALPILSYFTNAAIFSAKGKDKQRSQMAAQSVLEEMSGYTALKQIKALTADPTSGWQNVSVSANPYEMQKNITIDNTPYKARVTFDYSKYNAATITGGAIGTAEFNDYDVPKIRALWSTDTSVAYEEEKHRQEAINYYKLYFEHSQNVALSDGQVKDILNRITFVRIDPVGTDKAELEVYNLYSVSSASTLTGPAYKQMIFSEEVEKSTLGRVIVLYKPFAVEEERMSLVIDNSLGYDRSNFNICFVCQATSVSSSYHIKCTSSSSEYNFFTNLKIPVNGIPAGYLKEFVLKEKDERFADITVKLYKQNETSLTDANCLATIHSAKGV